MNLALKKCEPCEEGGNPLSQFEIADCLNQLKTEWKVIDGKKITKEFKFKNFQQAMNFADKVADIAESENHHPDIHILYNRVVLDLWTHAVHGLSENDFILASKIENLLAKRSQKEQ